MENLTVTAKVTANLTVTARVTKHFAATAIATALYQWQNKLQLIYQ